MVRKIVTKLTVIALAAFLSACAGGTFETMYDSGPAPSITKNWRVVDVNVVVPRTLSVSEAHILVPKADIVWREDPAGNRYDQVSRIVAKGVRDGARSLHGKKGVRIDVTVSRFHAMTLEAEALKYDVGVHNIDLTARVVDAKTGEVLVPPTFIRAEFPAMTGVRMTQARLRGETQKSQIEAHLANVFAGWLGVGPDPRATFTRLGG
jgi:hypothetical protein